MGIRVGERFQRCSVPINLTSVLCEIKAIITKASNKYIDIYNIKMNYFFFFLRKK